MNFSSQLRQAQRYQAPIADQRLCEKYRYILCRYFPIISANLLKNLLKIKQLKANYIKSKLS